MTLREEMTRQLGTESMKRPATRSELYDMVDILKDQVLKLHARLVAIETKGVEYRGVWQAPETYHRGNLTTFQGSIWHANKDTRERPGSGSADWTLAVKGGGR